MARAFELYYFFVLVILVIIVILIVLLARKSTDDDNNDDNNDVIVETTQAWVAASSGNGIGNNVIYSSGVPTTWTYSTLATDIYVKSFATNDDKVWVGVGSNVVNNIIYSLDDGATWENSDNVFDTQGYTVATDKKGNWVAGGKNSDNKNMMHSSDNGKTWAKSDTVLFTGGNPDVVYTNTTGHWIVGGNNTAGSGPVLYHSTDNGVTWSPGTTEAGDDAIFTPDTLIGYVNDIIYTGTYWLAGGHPGSANTQYQISYSSNGTSWTRSTGDVLFALANQIVFAANGDNICASGGQFVHYSTDSGLSWTRDNTVQ